jgi:hypothetical protein
MNQEFCDGLVQFFCAASVHPEPGGCNDNHVSINLPLDPCASARLRDAYRRLCDVLFGAWRVARYRVGMNSRQFGLFRARRRHVA